MTKNQAIGKIWTFHPNFPSMLPVYLGRCRAAKDLPPEEPGNIPNFELELKGRSGKVLVVDMLKTWAQWHDDWEDALLREKTIKKRKPR